MRSEPQDELFALVQENLKVSKKILETAEKTRSYIFWQSVGSWVRMALWLIPLILAVIFLPPLLAKVYSMYQSLLGAGGSSGFNLDLEQFKSLNAEAGKIINIQTR